MFLSSGEQVLQTECGLTLSELRSKVGTRPDSSLPIFSREDGSLLEDELVEVQDESLTLVWVEWWHIFDIEKPCPSEFQRFVPKGGANFNVSQLEMALLMSLPGSGIDYHRGLRADIEIAVVTVLSFYREGSSLLESVREFTAFSIGYLPEELASVISVLLAAAMTDMERLLTDEKLNPERLEELNRFGSGENLTALLFLIEDYVKKVVSTLESAAESEEEVPISFKLDPMPKTICVGKTWKEEAYVFFQRLRPKFIRFLELRDLLSFDVRSGGIDGFVEMGRPFTHDPDHYEQETRFRGFWAL